MPTAIAAGVVAVADAEMVATAPGLVVDCFVAASKAAVEIATQMMSYVGEGRWDQEPAGVRKNVVVVAGKAVETSLGLMVPVMALTTGRSGRCYSSRKTHLVKEVAKGTAATLYVSEAVERPLCLGFVGMARSAAVMELDLSHNLRGLDMALGAVKVAGVVGSVDDQAKEI